MRNGNARIRWEIRSDCPAMAHDTRRAYDVYGCRCKPAKKDVATMRRARRIALGLPVMPEIQVGPREGCPAEKHGTRSMRYRYKCVCPEALEDMRRAKQKYYQENRERLLANANRRAREKRAANPKPERCRYEQIEEKADWVIVQRILSEGPQSNSSLYDRWMAAEILIRRGEKDVADKVGGHYRTIKNFRDWLKAQGKAD